MHLLVLVICLLITRCFAGGYPEGVEKAVPVNCAMKWVKTGCLSILPVQDGKTYESDTEFLTNEFTYLGLNSTLVISTGDVNSNGAVFSGSAAGSRHQKISKKSSLKAAPQKEMMTLYLKNNDRYQSSAFGQWASWISVRLVSPGSEMTIGVLEPDQNDGDFVSYRGQLQGDFGADSFLSWYRSRQDNTELLLYPYSLGEVKRVALAHPTKILYEWRIPADTLEAVLKKGDRPFIESPAFKVGENGHQTNFRLKLRKNEHLAHQVSVHICPEGTNHLNIRDKSTVRVSLCSPQCANRARLKTLFSIKTSMMCARVTAGRLSLLGSYSAVPVGDFCEKAKFCRDFPDFTERPDSESLEEQPWLSQGSFGAADYYQIEIAVE